MHLNYKMNNRLFEFEDKKWLPEIIREGMTDYLRFVLNSGNFYEPVAELIVQLLIVTDSKQVIDIGSGGGGTTGCAYRHMGGGGGGNQQIL